jgi:NitT/TauT family transport system substrate-binding protein
VVAAFEDAIALTNRDSQLAARIYVAHEPQKHEPAWIEAMIRDPKLITYNSTARGTLAREQFMYKVGTLKHEAASWRELFWENEAGKPGS